jgi:hypothetical protein
VVGPVGTVQESAHRRIDRSVRELLHGRCHA